MKEQRKVLVVDDDSDIRAGASARLRMAGYATCEAGDGEQGVHSAASQRPDAVVMDVRMPRMDGLAALTELRRRQDTRHIPVVMLSASLSDEDAALGAGARFFLRKPYSGAALLSAVDSAIGR